MKEKINKKILELKIEEHMLADLHRKIDGKAKTEEYATLYAAMNKVNKSIHNLEDLVDILDDLKTNNPNILKEIMGEQYE